jgi:hypothetical protein
MVYHCYDSSDDESDEVVGNENFGVESRAERCDFRAFRDQSSSDEDSDDVTANALKCDSESDEDESTDNDNEPTDHDDDDEDKPTDHDDHEKSIGEEGNGNDEDNSANSASAAQSWPLRRTQIVNMLLDPIHDFHLLTAKTKKERCEKMWRKYAPEFSETLVVGALQRYLLKLQKGELRPETTSKTIAAKAKDGKPFWKSRKKTSDAYGLLYRIRLQIPVERLTTEEVYSKHEIFQQYSMKDFKAYDKRMVKLTSKHSEQLEEDIRLWKLQRAATPRKATTSRNKLFWSSHPAKQQVIEDTKSGKAASMKPKELYQNNYEETLNFITEGFATI